MNSNPSPRRDDPVTEILLESVLDPSVSAETLDVESRAAGIDVDAIQRRAATSIGAAVRRHFREAALAGTGSRAADLARIRQELATQTLEQLRQWLRSVVDGVLGPTAQTLAQPCFRNRKSEELTDEELRDLVAEIQFALSDPSRTEPNPDDHSSPNDGTPRAWR